MPLRMIEIVLHEKERSALEELLKGEKLPVEGIWANSISGLWEYPVKGVWQKRFVSEFVLVKILVAAETSEAWMDVFQQRFGRNDGFRVTVLPVEASLPPPKEQTVQGELTAEITGPEAAKAAGAESSLSEGVGPREKLSREIPAEDLRVTIKPRSRLSREELYNEISGSARLDVNFVLMVILSSIVAAIGIMENSVAVIIGAMVIAPLLGPNVALSLATTLGDPILARRALKANLVGLGLALLLSIAIGHVLLVDPSIPEISRRTSVGLVEVTLALASGCAGALAFTAGLSATLIGVMVAVALLPPLVTFGLLLGSGQTTLAQGAMLLFLVNLISVNLAGVATFLAHGIKPFDWWEAKKARRSTLVAILVWGLLLAALVGFILFSKGP